MAQMDGEDAAGKALSGSRARQLRRQVVAGLITIAALVIAVVHLLRPDLKVDGVTVVLLVVAVLPWLGELLESIELPGGAKLQYRQLNERIAAAEQESEYAAQLARGVSRQAHLAVIAAGSPDARMADAEDALFAVERLAAEYVQVRGEQAPGAARTSRMERVFAQLVAATRAADDFDLDAALGSDDPGLRLAAYARLYAVPDGDRLEQLVTAVADEPIAFNQYWGFQAIGATVDAAGADRIPLGVARRLQACLETLPGRSDRMAALQSVLAKLSPAA